MRFFRELGEGRAAVLVLLAAGFAVCAAINIPGHLSYDSIVQLCEGRVGSYGNWHPPMMSWLLGIFDALWPGAALFVVFDCALLFGALALLVTLGARASRAALAISAAILFTPQVLLYEGIVWKDVLFADLGVVGFVVLAFAGAHWQLPRTRFLAVAIAILLLTVAALVRQNGAVVIPAAALCLGWFALRFSPRRWAAAATYTLGSVIASALLVTTIHSALALRIHGDASPTLQFRLLEFYDLIGAVKRDPKLALPILDDDDPDLEALMRSDGVRLYTPERNDTLAQSAPLQSAYFASPDETLPEEWRNLILRHTGLYLALRAEVFRWVFLTPDLAACRPVFTGISGPANYMAKLGMKARFDARDAALGYYAAAFMGTPLLSHAAFAALALLLQVVLFARGRPEDIAMAWLLISTYLFTASFFVISIACDYRYLYFLDLATLVAMFHVSLDWSATWSTIETLVARLGFERRGTAR